MLMVVVGSRLQTVVPGNRNNAMLQNLLPDTPYNITVEAVYAEGPGGSLNGNGRTGEEHQHLELLWVQRFTSSW